MLDILRWMTLLLGGVSLGLTLFVLRMYRYANRLSKRAGVAKNTLPYHVGVIATSHCLLIVGQMATVSHNIAEGEDWVWWGAPLALSVFTLSIVGLVDMLRHENLRIYQLTHPTEGGKRDGGAAQAVR